MNLKKKDECTYEIAKEDCMNVPVTLYVDEHIIKSLEKDKSLEQAKNVACMPGIYKHVVILPDAHQGYGFPIGTVAIFDKENGCLSPGGVGYDINCGVRLLSTNLEREEVEDKIEILMDRLFDEIPVGVGCEAKLRIGDQEFDELLTKGLDWAKEHGYATEDDIQHCEQNGKMPSADPSFVSNKAKSRGKKQVGTLGAGNHFLEVQYVEKIYDKDLAEKFRISHEGQVVVMIHSGSRGLGHQICTDYLKKAGEEFPDLVARLPERELTYIPTSHPMAKEYYGAMSSAMNFSWCNRQLMAYHTRKVFKEIFGENTNLLLVYDLSHNMATIEEHVVNGEKKEVYVHRKGAARAFGPGHSKLPYTYKESGQPVIIPGSMGTASYLLAGTNLGEEKSFSSTPHGAGRAMSRHQALKEFKAEKITSDLNKEHIYVKSRSKRGIVEEAPKCYKDIDEVSRIAENAGISKTVARLKPLGVLKG